MDFSVIPCFAALSEEGRVELLNATVRRSIRSGEVVVIEGEPSTSMFFVVSGRFAIRIRDHADAIAELSVGQTIGEIGFLSGEPRTATAIAVRDSIVLELSAKNFNVLCERFPKMLKEISISLARKLAAATNAYRGQPYAPPGTLALCTAGGSQKNDRFISLLAARLGETGSTVILDQSSVTTAIGGIADRERLSQWLHAQESQHCFLLYVGAEPSSEWTRICLRQADQVLLLADGDDKSVSVEPNPVESILSASGVLEQVLVICHRRKHQLVGNRRWCDQRQNLMRHHVALDDVSTIDRLVRFLTGTATGLVASGGGAFTAAHLGVFRAFGEADISFDMVGGASGGVAMGCSLAVGVSPAEMSDGTERMMVRSGALKRYTLPIYSLVDHQYFDQCMRENYGERRLEDLWLNFFAVSTNLSSGQLDVHQRGPLWKVVRASASIPGLLPPMITEEGDLLVDGGILDNVPLATMKTLKTGPNIVLCFEPREQSRTSMRYEELPGRQELIGKLIRRSRSADTDMPRIGSVLTQCMLLNNTSMTEAGDEDLILSMSLPDDLKLNDWHRHRELTEIGYWQAKAWLDENAGNPLLARFRTPSSSTAG